MSRESEINSVKKRLLRAFPETTQSVQWLHSAGDADSKVLGPLKKLRSQIQKKDTVPEADLLQGALEFLRGILPGFPERGAEGMKKQQSVERFTGLLEEAIRIISPESAKTHTRRVSRKNDPYNRLARALKDAAEILEQAEKSGIAGLAREKGIYSEPLHKLSSLFVAGAKLDVIDQSQIGEVRKKLDQVLHALRNDHPSTRRFQGHLPQMTALSNTLTSLMNGQKIEKAIEQLDKGSGRSL